MALTINPIHNYFHPIRVVSENNKLSIINNGEYMTTNDGIFLNNGENAVNVYCVITPHNLYHILLFTNTDISRIKDVNIINTIGKFPEMILEYIDLVAAFVIGEGYNVSVNNDVIGYRVDFKGVFNDNKDCSFVVPYNKNDIIESSLSDKQYTKDNRCYFVGNSMFNTKRKMIDSMRSYYVNNELIEKRVKFFGLEVIDGIDWL